MIEMTEHEKLQKLLVDAGFTSGWVLHGTELVVWDNEQDPPAPLKKPDSANE